MSAPSRIVWTDIELNSAARQLLEPYATIVVGSAAHLEHLETAHGAIVGSLLPANREFFARATQLQVIARLGMGFDNLDLAAASHAGVCAVNTPDAPTESTAEFTLALMLAVARRVALADRRLRSGSWDGPDQLQGFDLAGKALGLVGCGRIGRRVAELAAAFQMRVVAHDPLAAVLPPDVERAPSLDALLAQADIVSLHLPLKATTRQLINARALGLMKPGAILINTSRGAIVDDTDLLAALRSGHLCGAGLDVWDPEPVSPTHPLLELPHVVVTPHMAAYTREGRVRSHRGAAEQVLQVWRGEMPASLLNPDVWPRRRRN
jgi:Lactate dehydrogenase and related dehydrogenases